MMSQVSGQRKEGMCKGEEGKTSAYFKEKILHHILTGKVTLLYIAQGGNSLRGVMSMIN